MQFACARWINQMFDIYMNVETFIIYLFLILEK